MCAPFVKGQYDLSPYINTVIRASTNGLVLQVSYIQDIAAGLFQTSAQCDVGLVFVNAVVTCLANKMSESARKNKLK